MSAIRTIVCIIVVLLFFGNLAGCAPATKCPKGQQLCDGVCKDLTSDPQNCGACGNVCGAGEICSNGKCCLTGQTACYGVCVDLKSSINNCGQCGKSCNDGIFCTVDSCTNGQCLNEPDSLQCADENACTEDYCDPRRGCQHDTQNLEGKPCDDKDPCTDSDVCSKGACTGTPKNCDDNNPCTVDTCLGGTCASTPDNSLCDDQNACNGMETCDQVSGCQAGTPLNCEDDNICTEDSCSKAYGCLHKPNTKPCDDGNPCTVGDACNNGLCEPGNLMNCDDKELCTSDYCLDGSCQHDANPDCTGNCPLCSSDQDCVKGKCVCKTGTKECNTNGAITCIPLDACCYDSECDDADACTIDTCESNQCKHNEIACENGKECQRGNCVCPKGTTDCGGMCYDLSADPQHCGSCVGSQCGSGQQCVNGQCQDICGINSQWCVDKCVYLYDPQNCCWCGHSCPDIPCHYTRCNRNYCTCEYEYRCASNEYCIDGLCCRPRQCSTTGQIEYDCPPA